MAEVLEKEGDYAIGDRDELRTLDHNGKQIAKVVRSVPGFEVLVCPTIMFVDIDTTYKEHALRLIRRWVYRNDGWAFRAYHTKGGIRLLSLIRQGNPFEFGCQEIMRQLDADEKYVRLCAEQQCFRARLTPKPSRVGIVPLGTRPLCDWLPIYTEASNNYATCRYVEIIGSGYIVSDIETVMHLHDEATRAHSGLELA